MKQNDSLIQSLLECARICDMCADACLSEKDVNMLSRCIKLDLDCADVCYTAARLIQRNSEVAQHYISVCEQICTLCQKECEQHADMHKHCALCAQACKKCAQECRNYHSVNVTDQEMME